MPVLKHRDRHLFVLFAIISLAAGRERRALLTIVTAIVVERNLHLRLYELALNWQAEAQVLDGEATANPLLLIVGANRQIEGRSFGIST